MAVSSLWVLPVGAASLIREAARTRAAGEQAAGMTERSGREAAGVTDAGEGPTSGAAATGSGSEDSWTCARRRAALGAVRLWAIGRRPPARAGSARGLCAAPGTRTDAAAGALAPVCLRSSRRGQLAIKRRRAESLAQGARTDQSRARSNSRWPATRGRAQEVREAVRRGEHDDQRGDRRNGAALRAGCSLGSVACQLASLALASRLRLTPCSAASSASARCTCGGMRTRNSPL